MSRTFKGGKGLFISLGTKHVLLVPIGSKEFRIESNSLLKGGKRLSITMKSVECIALLVVDRGIVRVKLTGLLKSGKRLFVSLCVVEIIARIQPLLFRLLRNPRCACLS